MVIPVYATATAMLSQYQHCPSPGHFKAVKQVIKYLKGTASHDIQFYSSHNNILQSFLHFPVQSKQELMGISDTNWGAQDQYTPFQKISPLLSTSQDVSPVIYLVFMGQYISFSKDNLL